jgi:hypothetical protein
MIGDTDLIQSLFGGRCDHIQQIVFTVKTEIGMEMVIAFKHEIPQKK